MSIGASNDPKTRAAAGLKRHVESEVGGSGLEHGGAAFEQPLDQNYFRALERERAVLVLSFYDEQPAEAVAALMGRDPVAEIH